jgi:hypothetical protein
LQRSDRGSTRLTRPLDLSGKLDLPVSGVLDDRLRDVVFGLPLREPDGVEIALGEWELVACPLDGTTLRTERLTGTSTSSCSLDVFALGSVDGLVSGSDLLCCFACAPRAPRRDESDR